MGHDKALLPFLGQPLISRVLDRVALLADEVLVTTNRPEAYAFLGVRSVPDLRPGRGALGGLYTALAAATHPLVAVVACDLPFASLELLTYARDRLLTSDLDAVVPTSVGGIEPLHAVYRKATCLPAIEQAMDAGEWKLIAWFSQANVCLLTAQETSLHDPGGLAFTNLNTPEDFRRAEALVTSLGE